MLSKREAAVLTRVSIWLAAMVVVLLLALDWVGKERRGRYGIYVCV
jgi:preprotein translocase subunit SecG